MSQIGVNDIKIFINGTKADANEVNNNFAAIKTAHNDTDNAVNDLSKSAILKDGSVLFEQLQSYGTVSITGATNATPIVITAPVHGRATGDQVYISGVLGNTAANGTFTVTVIDVNTFSLNGSVGNGVYVSGGTVYLLAQKSENLIPKQQLDNAIGAITQPAYVPYSVNSGVIDSNGYANFISKVDNTSVKILATSTPLILSYPDGSQESISSDVTVSSIANGSTTILVKEKGNATVQQCTGLITESSIPPSSPNNGDYWLNIGVKPYQPKKYNGTTWANTQFVKLGEVTVSSGSMGTPISYAFNGKYSSGRFTIAASSGYQLSHNIGTDKVKVKAYGAPSVGGPLAEFVTFYTTGPLWYGAAINHITKNIYALQTYSPVTISEYSAYNALDVAVEAIIFMERTF